MSVRVLVSYVTYADKLRMMVYTEVDLVLRLSIRYVMHLVVESKQDSFHRLHSTPLHT